MKRSTIKRVVVALAVLALLVALSIPALALARAGGGQVGGGGSRSGGSSSGGGFSGGSSGGFIGGSSSSGGGGGGSCCTTLIIIGVIIVVLVVVSGANKKKGGGGDAASYAAMPDQPMVAPPMFTGDPFAEIKAADPAFNEEMFKGRVNEMFIAIQYAWMARNMEPVRRFLSDQQFTVLNTSVQNDYIAKGQINKLDNIHIDNMQPVEVTKMGEFDSVKMLVTATCIDYTVDERTNQLVNPGELGDGKTPRTFQEYWTFMRKSGVQSKVDATIQKCPNCGGPVTDGNYVKCSYCGVQLNDPTLDWVLMRIEQVD